MRVLALVLFFAATTTLGANECFDGFYTGLGMGGSLTSARERMNASGIMDVFGQGGFSRPILISSDGASKRFSLMGTIYLGYGCAWDPIYLGLEGSFRAARGKTTTQNNVQITIPPSDTFPGNYNLFNQTQTKLKPIEFDLDLRPGVLLRPTTLLYGKVGVALNKVSVQTNTVFSAVPDTLAGIPPEFMSNSLTLTQSAKKRRGFRLGLGLEQEVCENWFIRGEYVFTRYRKIHVENPGSITQIAFDPFFGANLINNVTNDTRIKPSTHSMYLGVSYYWL